MSTPQIPQKSPIVQQTAPGTYAWCSCGRSARQPFCDGSHAGTEFAPLPVDVAQAKVVAWCACKHTQGAPFCDGSHKRLST
ncbi:MAG: CDGSH iron-sulfur domain-containing protein [Verrucomicrobia bacterium]|nr:CDGSH iron-sulfur domain-containing protein [Verrucomicrobiota bacterium]